MGRMTNRFKLPSSSMTFHWLYNLCCSSARIILQYERAVMQPLLKEPTRWKFEGEDDELIYVLFYLYVYSLAHTQLWLQVLAVKISKKIICLKNGLPWPTHWWKFSKKIKHMLKFMAAILSDWLEINDQFRQADSGGHILYTDIYCTMASLPQLPYHRDTKVMVKYISDMLVMYNKHAWESDLFCFRDGAEFCFWHLSYIQYIACLPRIRRANIILVLGNIIQSSSASWSRN